VRQVQLLVLTLVAAAFAQTPPEPDANDVFYALQEKLVPLELQQAAWGSKGAGFVGLGRKSVSEIPGGRSPVRFKSAIRLEFVVRSAAAATPADPNTVYSLRKLAPKKNKREMILMAQKADPSEAVLPVDFSRYGNSSYKLAVGPLKPGEYALGRATLPQRVFCFGID